MLNAHPYSPTEKRPGLWLVIVLPAICFLIASGPFLLNHVGVLLAVTLWSVAIALGVYFHGRKMNPFISTALVGLAVAGSVVLVLNLYWDSGL